ncbi:MFS transporter [Fulvivirgaceae bacterium PWU4]|uniref:MFS transporter n=1 Tax=Chryseosolibacter histidini TaxID=2782349 RepID=A0AAP2DLC7_9BACT|nr:MFS transporter [Chryseosolibacter histidini]MBT1697062.1 MFS transporter [Chryseosolibacter histidini]
MRSVEHSKVQEPGGRAEGKDNASIRKRIRSIAGGALGNLVEWYDWYAYSTFALYFSASFFPKGDQTIQLLQSAGVFALGFIMRPVGGWVFGSLGDRYGRKYAMTLSVIMMSAGSLIIAIIPVYGSIGAAAPISLLLARLLQGLSVGGEYGVSATYLSEMATRERRGFYSSFQYVTLVGGQITALGVQLLLQFMLTDAELHLWGWRIPFVIGAILSLIVFYIRSNLDETKQFMATKKTGSAERSPMRGLLKYPKAIFTVVGLTLGGTLAFYTYTTYMQKFLVNSLGIPKETSTILSFLSLLLFAMLQPVFGSLSDRIGRKPLLIAFGISGTLATVPLFNAMSAATSQVSIFLFMMIALVIVSGYTSINAVVKAELFPASVRALGVGLPYALTVAIFGGSAEYLALLFKQSNHESYFYYYISFCILISLLVYIFMDDTQKKNKMEVVQ